MMVFAIVGACTTVAVAQDSSATSTTKAASGRAESNQMKDCVMMKDGKLHLMKGTSITGLDKNLTLANGTVIKTDGTVKAADGTEMTLKEGEAIDMEGKLIKGEPMK